MAKVVGAPRHSWMAWWEEFCEKLKFVVFEM